MANSKQSTNRKNLKEQLAELSREQLLQLLTELLEDAPEIGDWLAAALPGADAPAQAKTAQPKPKQKVDAEVYRRQAHGILHSLDYMRASEAYWHVEGLTGQLQGVEKKALEFLAAGDAEAALRILLALLEESSEGFEVIDDSDGYFGDYLNGLGATLAEVILSLDLDEERREDIVSDLDELHGKLSNYGVDGLEIAIAAAQQGWDVDEEGEDDESTTAVSAGWGRESLSVTLTRAKLNVLERQGQTEDYLALCLARGSHLRYALKLVELGRAAEGVKHALKHLTDAGEALKLARQLRESEQLDDAMKVAERGLKLDGHKAGLGEWLGPLEEERGRTAQALVAWQAAFHDAPALETWRTIKRLAGSRWKKLQPELMASLKKHYSQQPLAEVLIEEQEWDAAIKVADKQTYDYNLVAKVADALIAHRPEWVIRVSLKQSDELIAKTQSKYYYYAIAWLTRVKAAYAQMGQTAEWQSYLAKLKGKYPRRSALLAQLKGL
ncbi:MAG: hypothetical protein SF097_03565 [Acidobacteriota bacterium]|nr:hypothetical protein [Acidobacteriota bacterium]